MKRKPFFKIFSVSPVFKIFFGVALLPPLRTTISIMKIRRGHGGIVRRHIGKLAALNYDAQKDVRDLQGLLEGLAEFMKVLKKRGCAEEMREALKKGGGTEEMRVFTGRNEMLNAFKELDKDRLLELLGILDEVVSLWLKRALKAI